MAKNSGGLLVQGTQGSGDHKNFELVIPVLLADVGGIEHWWRANNEGGLPWRSGGRFSGGVVQSLSMVESVGHPPQLHLLARIGEQVNHLWRDHPGSWAFSSNFGSGVRGAVGLADLYDRLVAVLPTNAGMARYEARLTDRIWRETERFGPAQVTAVSLIDSSWANLEVVSCSDGGDLQHWYRSGGSWTPGSVFAERAARSNVALIESGRTQPSGQGSGVHAETRHSRAPRVIDDSCLLRSSAGQTGDNRSPR